MIAIKEMKMPSCCLDCEFFSNYSDAKLCDFTLEEINESEYGRAEHCPLVEIVTCKDCKYWNINDTYCKYTNNFTNKDFYCAGGKGKNNVKNNSSKNQ
jgi:hypothetical protein